MLLILLLLVYLLGDAKCYDSCLHYRSLCLRDETCNAYISKFQETCSYDLNVCSGNSLSDCVYALRQIRQIFPTSTCTCYQALGFSAECDYFRQLIWNHPCERQFHDIGNEMKLKNRQLYQIHEKQKYHGGEVRRTTRTPIADQVQQWKTQLSGELTRVSIQHKTCDSALYEVCLKHVSCSQLWAMFRKNCDVDQDNRCRMQDREICWQSFEGLTWTGLGDCQCQTSNSSDCHWIRLHTNYNKCIYEISKSGQFSSLLTLSAQRQRENSAIEYRKRYENNQALSTTVRPRPVWTTMRPTTPRPTTTTPQPTTTTTTTQQPTTTATPQPTTKATPRPRPTKRPTTTTTTAPSWWKAPNVQSDYGRHEYRIVQQSQPEYTKIPTNSFKLKAIIDKDQTASSAGPRKEYPAQFVPKKSSARSSCQDAIRRCESVDECRWHLGELRVRCASITTCRRDECAASLQRFSTYVPFALVESIMFCHCAPGDQECLAQQEMIYPKCLYKNSGFLQTCTQAAQKCDDDTRCRHLRHALTAHCPVKNGECSKVSLDDCRRTILSARASILEQPCFCKLSDVQCLAHQNTMIPTNPCIETAMIEYSRIMGYNKMMPVGTAGPAVPAAEAAVPPSLATNRIVASRDSEEERIEEPVVVTSVHYKPPPTPRPSPRSVVVTTQASLTTTQRPIPTEYIDNSSKKSGFMDLFGIFGKNKDKKEEPEEKEIKKEQQQQVKKSKFRTTVEPPKASEAPPPWISTTQPPPTTTTMFVTHAPPPPDGCLTKDANGREIFTHIGEIMRRYVDWSGRCSTWCECESKDNLVCETVPCLEHGTCDAPLTTIEFGERVFLKDRGACYCEKDNFICEFAEETPEVYPGLYLSIGYSMKDVESLRQAVPRDILDKAGFSSSDASNDIASQMQIAFELLLPKTIQCRIVTMNEVSEPGNALYRIEWYGRNEMFNHTKVRWHSDGAEKICSPYVRKLADHFALNESPRFQLVLSTVKQVKVLDYLDGLPIPSLIINTYQTGIILPLCLILFLLRLL